MLPAYVSSNVHTVVVVNDAAPTNVREIRGSTIAAKQRRRAEGPAVDIVPLGKGRVGNEGVQSPVRRVPVQGVARVEDDVGSKLQTDCADYKQAHGEQGDGVRDELEMKRSTSKSLKSSQPRGPRYLQLNIGSHNNAEVRSELVKLWRCAYTPESRGGLDAGATATSVVAEINHKAINPETDSVKAKRGIRESVFVTLWRSSIYEDGKSFNWSVGMNLTYWAASRTEYTFPQPHVYG